MLSCTGSERHTKHIGDEHFEFEILLFTNVELAAYPTHPAFKIFSTQPQSCFCGAYQDGIDAHQLDPRTETTDKCHYMSKGRMLLLQNFLNKPLGPPRDVNDGWFNTDEVRETNED